MFQTVLTISEGRTEQMCKITKECLLLLESFTPVEFHNSCLKIVHRHETPE